MELADHNGIVVIDSYPIFNQHYAETHQNLDYLPTDGHWNAAAHRLMARELEKVINAADAPFGRNRDPKLTSIE